MLPPADALDQLFAHLAAHRAAGQQVLCAVNFGRFAQDGGAAMRHQQVDRRAQGRVGADARITVRAAALQADRDVGHAAWHTLRQIDGGQHGLDQLDALGHGQAGAAAVLDVEGLQRAALGQAAVRQPRSELVGLAAQTHRQHAGEIGVGGVARHGALQHLHPQTFGVHAATRAVGERNHAIHMGKVCQRSGVDGFGEMVGNGTGHSRRAVHAGENADVVTRGHAAVRAHITHELGVASRCLGFDVGAKRVVPRKVAFVGAHVKVVGVHMLARSDVFSGKADDLVVAAHGVTGRDGAGGDFVARRDQTAHSDGLYRGAREQLLAADDHVIGGMEANAIVHKKIEIKKPLNGATTGQCWGHR